MAQNAVCDAIYGKEIFHKNFVMFFVFYMSFSNDFLQTDHCNFKLSHNIFSFFLMGLTQNDDKIPLRNMKYFISLYVVVYRVLRHF